MSASRANEVDQHLPLSLAVFHMLLELSDGERHGYALKRAIFERTKGKLNLGSGALYGTIGKLVDATLIEESGERPDPHLDDERRRYYRITPLGKRVVAAEAVRLRELVRLAETHLRLPRLA